MFKERSIVCFDNLNTSFLPISLTITKYVWNSSHSLTLLKYLINETVKSETASRCVLCKKVFLKISQNSQENACSRVSFLINVGQACSFIKKETLTQVFACEFCKISKNTFFTEHLWTTPSLSFNFVFYELHEMDLEKN